MLRHVLHRTGEDTPVPGRCPPVRRRRAAVAIGPAVSDQRGACAAGIDDDVGRGRRPRGRRRRPRAAAGGAPTWTSTTRARRLADAGMREVAARAEAPAAWRRRSLRRERVDLHLDPAVAGMAPGHDVVAPQVLAVGDDDGRRPALVQGPAVDGDRDARARRCHHAVRSGGRPSTTAFTAAPPGSTCSASIASSLVPRGSPGRRGRRRGRGRTPRWAGSAPAGTGVRRRRPRRARRRPRRPRRPAAHRRRTRPTARPAAGPRRRHCRTDARWPAITPAEGSGVGARRRAAARGGLGVRGDVADLAEQVDDLLHVADEVAAGESRPRRARRRALARRPGVHRRPRTRGRATGSRGARRRPRWRSAPARAARAPPAALRHLGGSASAPARSAPCLGPAPLVGEARDQRGELGGGRAVEQPVAAPRRPAGRHSE